MPTRAVVAADLYCDVPPDDRPGWHELLPGLTVVALGTLAAAFVADVYGAPLMLMALLLGLALNFLSSDKRLHAGLGFASRSLLRWGIVLAGLRITLAQVVGLGPAALVGVIAIAGLTIGAGVLVARRLGFGTAFGVLAGGSVAICGASAALAIATTLGPRRISEAQLTVVLIGIAAASAAAMILYPIAAHAIGLSDVRAGFLLGASIHDVAQALGAGHAYSAVAGDIATIVKLTRVALLAPILVVIVFFLPREAGQRARVGAPWFVVGFFILAGVNSVVSVPPDAAQFCSKAAGAMLAAAVTATAIRAPLPHLLEAGRGPLLVILVASLMAFAAALAGATLMLR